MDLNDGVAIFFPFSARFCNFCCDYNPAVFLTGFGTVPPTHVSGAKMDSKDWDSLVQASNLRLSGEQTYLEFDSGN